MKATIIFEDMMVSINGMARKIQSMPPYDPNWRVVQWNDDHGWIEVHKGDRLWLTDIGSLSPFLAAHELSPGNDLDINVSQAD